MSIEEKSSKKQKHSRSRRRLDQFPNRLEDDTLIKKTLVDFLKSISKTDTHKWLNNTTNSNTKQGADWNWKLYDNLKKDIDKKLNKVFSHYPHKSFIKYMSNSVQENLLENVERTFIPKTISSIFDYLLPNMLAANLFERQVTSEKTMEQLSDRILLDYCRKPVGSYLSEMHLDYFNDKQLLDLYGWLLLILMKKLKIFSPPAALILYGEFTARCLPRFKDIVINNNGGGGSRRSGNHHHHNHHHHKNDENYDDDYDGGNNNKTTTTTNLNDEDDATRQIRDTIENGKCLFFGEHLLMDLVRTTISLMPITNQKILHAFCKFLFCNVESRQISWEKAGEIFGHILPNNDYFIANIGKLIFFNLYSENSVVTEPVKRLIGRFLVEHSIESRSEYENLREKYFPKVDDGRESVSDSKSERSRTEMTLRSCKSKADDGKEQKRTCCFWLPRNISRQFNKIITSPILNDQTPFQYDLITKPPSLENGTDLESNDTDATSKKLKSTLSTNELASQLIQHGISITRHETEDDLKLPYWKIKTKTNHPSALRLYKKYCHQDDRYVYKIVGTFIKPTLYTLIRRKSCLQTSTSYCFSETSIPIIAGDHQQEEKEEQMRDFESLGISTRRDNEITLKQFVHFKKMQESGEYHIEINVRIDYGRLFDRNWQRNYGFYFSAELILQFLRFIKTE